MKNKIKLFLLVVTSLFSLSSCKDNENNNQKKVFDAFLDEYYQTHGDYLFSFGYENVNISSYEEIYINSFTDKEYELNNYKNVGHIVNFHGKVSYKDNIMNVIEGNGSIEHTIFEKEEVTYDYTNHMSYNYDLLKCNALINDINYYRYAIESCVLYFDLNDYIISDLSLIKDYDVSNYHSVDLLTYKSFSSTSKNYLLTITMDNNINQDRNIYDKKIITYEFDENYNIYKVSIFYKKMNLANGNYNLFTFDINVIDSYAFPYDKATYKKLDGLDTYNRKFINLLSWEDMII